jgi:hypothetical protein
VFFYGETDTVSVSKNKIRDKTYVNLMAVSRAAVVSRLEDSANKIKLHLILPATEGRSSKF